MRIEYLQSHSSKILTRDRVEEAWIFIEKDRRQQKMLNKDKEMGETRKMIISLFIEDRV